MKLKLKADPTFQATVKVPVPGQKEPGEMVMTFKHRTKDEHAAFIEECREEAAKRREADEARKRGESEAAEAIERVLAEKSISEGAGYVMAVASGWDLEDEKGAVAFTRENVEIFLQNHHMAEHAIATTYTLQLLTAASGN